MKNSKNMYISLISHTFCFSSNFFIFFCTRTMKYRFIKIWSLFLCAVLLTSCFGDEGTSGLETKTLDDFTISVPTSWPLVSKDSQGVPNPSSWELVLIASASEPQNGFANNIVILERSVTATTSAKQYALASKTGIADQFYSYKELESGDLNFIDEQVSHVSVFKAQYNKNTPQVNYIQTSRICNGKAFTATIAVGKSITEFSRYKNLLSTFQCKTEK